MASETLQVSALPPMDQDAITNKHNALSPASAFIATHYDGEDVGKTGKQSQAEKNDIMIRSLQKEIEAHETQEQVKTSKLTVQPDTAQKANAQKVVDKVESILEREMAAARKDAPLETKPITPYVDDERVHSRHEEDAIQLLDVINQKYLELHRLKDSLVQIKNRMAMEESAVEKIRLDFEKALEEEIRNKLQQESSSSSSDPTRSALNRMEYEAKKRQIKKELLSGKGKAGVEVEQKVMQALDEKKSIEKQVAVLEKLIAKMRAQIHERSSNAAMHVELERRAQLKAEGKAVDYLSLPVPAPKPPPAKIERSSTNRLEEEKQRRAAAKALRAANVKA